ncbi:RNA polymerase sigma-70 factor [Mangrovibacterium lignilyticum]|uniref:RNA polymerase sigma-70 factor n=1 Tax=Mangrovibacterium lignilyticum TaxID=2668052 RepID=UPI001EE58447|nr:RNA polymerase sigma-70 factor [Mangrovibacterium lignilyticum]
MKSNQTTNKLIRQLRQSDIVAFNDLFDQYSSRLYHFAFGYLKSKEDTEELVQDVFTKIWETRSRLKEEHQFQSYLFTIAFNQIKKHFRSKKIVEKYLQHESRDLADKLLLEPNDTYWELTETVDRLVERMPDKRREVFVKSRIEGKNALEIADEMQISKKTAENHLHAALKFLKEELSRENLIGLLFFYIHFF